MSDPWAEVRRFAAGQYGLVSRRQALACGLTAETVRHRLRTERLRRVYGGVYQTQPGDCTWEAKAAAALLAVWSGGYPIDAVLAGPSAARLHALTPRDPASLLVAVPAGRHLVPPPGVRVIRRYSFERLVDPTSTFPWVTTPAATVIDCAASGSPEEALGWVADGIRSHRVSSSEPRQELLRRGRVRHLANSSVRFSMTWRPGRRAPPKWPTYVGWSGRMDCPKRSAKCHATGVPSYTTTRTRSSPIWLRSTDGSMVRGQRGCPRPPSQRPGVAHRSGLLGRCGSVGMHHGRRDCCRVGCEGLDRAPAPVSSAPLRAAWWVGGVLTPPTHHPRGRRQARRASASSRKSVTSWSMSARVCASDTSHCSSSPGGVRMPRLTPHSQDSSATPKSVAL